jgi:lipoate-protein ligase B
MREVVDTVATCELRDLGRVSYDGALAIQHDLVERRKRGEIPDQLLIVEHPHVVTMGRNGHLENLLASPEILAGAGIELARSSAIRFSICANGSATWWRMCARSNRY